MIFVSKTEGFFAYSETRGPRSPTWQRLGKGTGWWYSGRASGYQLGSASAGRLRRELADSNRDPYLPNLAASVNNHALRLAEAGRRGRSVDRLRRGRPPDRKPP
jgi:hypothetical protein